MKKKTLKQIEAQALDIATKQWQSMKTTAEITLGHDAAIKVLKNPAQSIGLARLLMAHSLILFRLRGPCDPVTVKDPIAYAALLVLYLHHHRELCNKFNV